MSSFICRSPSPDQSLAHNRHLIVVGSWRHGWTGRAKGASRQVRIPPLDLADLVGQVLDNPPSPVQLSPRTRTSSQAGA